MKHLFSCEDLIVEAWALDSIASFHSTFQNDQLRIYHSTDLKKVYLVDGNLLDILGRGEVHIKTSWVMRIKEGLSCDLCQEHMENNSRS